MFEARVVSAQAGTQELSSRLDTRLRGCDSLLCLPALIALTCSVASTAHAQSYPSKPIRLIVGAAAGGGTDFVARFMANKLTEGIGQQVIVDNRAGAGSTL